MTTAFTNKEPLFSTLWVSGGPTRDPDILKSNNKNKAPMTNIKRDQSGRKELSLPAGSNETGPLLPTHHKKRPV